MRRHLRICCVDAVQENSLPPPNWQRSVWELNGNATENNGYENEDLIVWMRTAALPTFRKLYRRVDHVGLFKNGLPKGTYSLSVSYSVFSVTMLSLLIIAFSEILCKVVTVKPLMLACPLFREPNKTAKLKGANINCRPNRTKLPHYFVLYGFNSPK